ncbi:unnamed protein product [Ixodes hexagonus]
MLDRRRDTMDDPDPTRMTDLETLLSTLGALFSVAGFFCIALGLSLPHLKVTLAGYIITPIGLVVFVAFLFIYHTGRRIAGPLGNNRGRGEEVASGNGHAERVNMPMVPQTSQILSKGLRRPEVPSGEGHQQNLVYVTYL